MHANAADSARLKRHDVVFCSYPKLLYVWPIIAMGFLFAFIGDEGAMSVVAGWAYALMLFVVLLSLGVDIERNYTVFWLVAFVAVFFLARWLSDVQHFTLLGDFYNWLFHRQMQYNRQLGLMLSILLTPPYLVMLAWARINDKWRVTHNEFEHYSFGRSDDSLARGAKRVRTTYPDIFELLLCGAGTMIVYSATGRTELRRIHNVPFLPLLRRRINLILESTQVSLTDAATLEEEVADEESEAAESRDSDQAADAHRDDRDPSGTGSIGGEKL